MALLIYSNGMDVRVATVVGEIFEKGNDPIDGYPEFTKVDWEYCGDDNNYRKRCAELENNNAALARQLHSVVAELDSMKDDNIMMKLKLNKVYGALGVSGFGEKTSA